MSQSEDMAAINGYFDRAVPINATATAAKVNWTQWYTNLSWYDKSMSQDIYDQARRRRKAFDAVNGSAEATGMTTEQMQQTPTTPSVTAEPPIAPTPSGKPGLKPGARPTIRQGSSGPAVTEWQTVIGTTADGKFGPNTAALTKSWQRQRGLTDDGVVGPKTWAAATAKPGAPTVKVTETTTDTGKRQVVTQKVSAPKQVTTPSGKKTTVVQTTTTKVVHHDEKESKPGLTAKIKEAGIFETIKEHPIASLAVGAAAVGGAMYFGKSK